MSDALVKTLNRLGYQAIFLPRTGLRPPEVYSFEERRLRRRGPLADFVTHSEPLPSKRSALADIEHEETTGKKTTAATSFLESALKCIGIASVPKVDLSFARDASLVFSFAAITSEAVDPSKIAPVLAGLALHGIPDDVIWDGHVYIAYEYLYAKHLKMRRADKQAFGNDVTGAIGAYVDVGAHGSVNVESENTITFASARGEVAAFAFKVARLQKREGGWDMSLTETARAVAGDADRPWIPIRGAAPTAVVDG